MGDQLGALNEITPAKTAAAARLVRSGKTYDLGRTLHADVPRFEGRYWQQSLVSAAHLINRRKPGGDRGGWGTLWDEDPARYTAGEPGIGMAVAEWLIEHRIAMTGADTWSYGAVPGEDPARPFVVPQTLNVKHGVFIMENLATAELAAALVYEFMFVLTHHKTRGSTASGIAPAAVV